MDRNWKEGQQRVQWHTNRERLEECAGLKQDAEFQMNNGNNFANEAIKRARQLGVVSHVSNRVLS